MKAKSKVTVFVVRWYELFPITHACVYECIHTQYTYTIHLDFKTRRLSKFIITDEPQR